MLLKNVSFEPIIAIQSDAKTEEFFNPQEEKEIAKEIGDWYIERYPRHFAWVAGAAEKTAVVEGEAATTAAGVQCDICGKMVANKAGLTAHMRSHK